MSAFDPVTYFQQQFDLLAKAVHAKNRPEAVTASIQPKLLKLLSQYQLKLPLAMHQERVVEAGGLLATLGAHATALRECYAPILATAASEGLAAPGLGSLRLRVQTEFGSVASSFELLMQRDAWVRHAHSVSAMRDLLRRVREGIGACVRHEKLYWLVLNGTRLAYRLCSRLMRPERSADAIETLAWCALCMEGMLPLLAPRFFEWRVQIYTALCHCYEAAGMVEGAARAVAHALERHEHLKALDKHDPVPQTEETNVLYARIERRLAALQLKYTTALAAPPEPEADAAAAKGKPPAKGAAEPEAETTEGACTQHWCRQMHAHGPDLVFARTAHSRHRLGRLPWGATPPEPRVAPTDRGPAARRRVSEASPRGAPSDPPRRPPSPTTAQEAPSSAESRSRSASALRPRRSWWRCSRA